VGAFDEDGSGRSSLALSNAGDRSWEKNVTLRHLNGVVVSREHINQRTAKAGEATDDVMLGLRGSAIKVDI
jgi:hypothetical protein